MVTTEVFENLKKLQGILVQKYDLEEKIESAPKQLSNQEELLAKSQKEFIEQQAQYDAVQEKVTSLDAELQDAIKAHEEGEAGAANTSVHREFEAFEKQINDAKAKEEEVRGLLRKEKKDLAELNERLQIAAESIKFQSDELAESKQSLDSELADYNQKLETLKAEESEIAVNLDQEIIFKFQRIIQRNSEGIVAVRNGVCTGCHMILPANFANEVREGENIKFCPYCSRILYYEDVADEQQEDFFSMGAAGSLAGFDDDELDLDLDDEDFKDEDEDLDKDPDASDDDSEDSSDED